MKKLFLPVLVGLALAAAALSAAAAGSAKIYLPVIRNDNPPQVGGCRVFPEDNVWNTPVDKLPVDARSDAMVTKIGSASHLHPDFGPGIYPKGYGIPYAVVPAGQPKVAINFTEYGPESDPGPYPIPADAPVEGGPGSGGDRHVLVIEQGTCKLYELGRAFPQPGGSWDASVGAVFDLTRNAPMRPAGWTSADAAGLPIFPGLARYEEAAAGEIRHALRFTAPETRKGVFTWPARHYASYDSSPSLPQMGMRFRLKASVDISGYPPQARAVLRALQKYGMILADNGSAWFVTGAPNPLWEDTQLNTLKVLTGADFELVDTSSMIIDPNSAQARQP